MARGTTATVVVDAMGGDQAPGAVLAGVEMALAADDALEVVLAGVAGVVEDFASTRERCTPLVATEVIEMDDHAAHAVRSKKDSSIVVGCRYVRDGHAQAFFSAGSTGACMVAATLVMGRIPGVARPAIAAVLPTAGDPVVLLDVGANADCKPENLVQFAHMGAAYARTVLGVAQPRVSLLNIGEEPTKGSVLAQEAHALMAEQLPGFVGNIEGRDVMTGITDVIVTDGFTGNVALKLLEGTSKTLLSQVKQAMMSSALTKAASIALKSPLTELKGRLDPDTYGGAPLLGVKGVCIIGHGSSGDAAVASALRVSAQAVRGSLTESIANTLA